MHRVLDGLRTVFFWFVLVVSIILIVLSFVPRCFGYSTCGVRENDMLPLLHRGDWILTKPINFEDIHTGDLLTFEDPDTGKRFSRTVAEKWTEKQQLVTRAAQSDALDPYTIAYRCTVGKVVRVVHFIGYPSVWLQTFWGKAVFALLYIIWLAAEIEVAAARKRRERADA